MKDYVNEFQLAGFLDGEIGNASLSFRLSGAFSRMLVGNERVDGSELQVTHSNFNYSIHETDHVAADADFASMVIPNLAGSRQRVIVYPDSDPGRYEVSQAAAVRSFQTGEIVAVPVGGETLEFRRRDGSLPSRLVTGLELAREGDHVAAECSLGVIHGNRPPKRFHWGVCAIDESFDSMMVVTDLANHYGALPDDAEIVLRLYSDGRTDMLERRLTARDVRGFRDGVAFGELFPDGAAFLAGDFGYFSLFCSYGGLFVYSSLHNGAGSLTLEHSF